MWKASMTTGFGGLVLNNITISRDVVSSNKLPATLDTAITPPIKPEDDILTINDQDNVNQGSLDVQDGQNSLLL